LARRIPGWLLVLAGLVLAGAVVFYGMRPSATSALPELSLAELDGSVSAVIKQQMNAVEEAPRSGAAWGRLGTVLKAFDFKPQALHCLAEAERLDPEEPRWPYLQAYLQSEASPVVTLGKLRRTVELCGNDPPVARLRLARLLAEMGRLADAEEELERLRSAPTDAGPIELLLAQIQQARGHWEEAMTLARVATQSSYTARSAWTLLASLQRRLGNVAEADRSSRQAAEASPDATWPDPFEEEVLVWRTDSRSLSDRAQSYLLAGRADKAWPLVMQLSAKYPDFPETWLLLGRAQYLQKNPKAAEQSLRRFLEMDPESVNGQFQLGMSLMALNRHGEAVEVFRHATTLKEDFGPAFFNLGFALAKSGQPREAIPAFQQAIRHNPDRVDSYILLADLHLQMGERAEAIRLADLAQLLDPADRRLPELRGKIGGPTP
jgi:tetratricopeptide (TPR) repeat protein